MTPHRRSYVVPKKTLRKAPPPGPGRSYPPRPDVVGATEASRILGVCRSTVRNFVLRGLLNTVDVGVPGMWFDIETLHRLARTLNAHQPKGQELANAVPEGYYPENERPTPTVFSRTATKPVPPIDVATARIGRSTGSLRPTAASPPLSIPTPGTAPSATRSFVPSVAKNESPPAMPAKPSVPTFQTIPASWFAPDWAPDAETPRPDAPPSDTTLGEDTEDDDPVARSANGSGRRR